jgi:EpsI family protein
MTESKKAKAPALSLVGTRREALIGGGLILAAGVAFAMKPRHQMSFLGGAKIENLVPKAFAGWNFVAASGLVLPPQDQLRDKLYSQLLTRTYANAEGAQIMLLIAYNAAQDGVVQVHRPEVCYPASGYQLTRIDDRILPLAANIGVPSRYIVAETGLRREEIIYWTRLGGYFPRHWTEQRWAVFMQNLEGEIPDGMLVRISSTMPDVGIEALDRFARDLYAHVGATMKHVLTGNL